METAKREHVTERRTELKGLTGWGATKRKRVSIPPSYAPIFAAKCKKQYLRLHWQKLAKQA